MHTNKNKNTSKNRTTNEERRMQQKKERVVAFPTQPSRNRQTKTCVSNGISSICRTKAVIAMPPKQIPPVCLLYCDVRHPMFDGQEQHLRHHGSDHDGPEQRCKARVGAAVWVEEERGGQERHQQCCIPDTHKYQYTRIAQIIKHRPTTTHNRSVPTTYDSKTRNHNKVVLSLQQHLCRAKHSQDRRLVNRRKNDDFVRPAEEQPKEG